MGKITTKLKRLSKKTLIFIAALMFAIADVYAAAQIFWSGTVQHSFTVVGIDAGLLVPSPEGYRDNVATNVLVDGRVALSIYQENFHDIWLRLSCASNASGLVVSATGQYYEYFLSQFGSEPTLQPVGDAFSLIWGNQAINKTKMMYYVPTVNNDPKRGGMLMCSFAFDTEGVTVPGNYVVEIRFEMGFCD